MGKKARNERRAARSRAQVNGGDNALQPAPILSPNSAVRTGKGAGNSRWDALAALEVAARNEVRAIAARDRAVRAARSTGASWADIARVLGVSRQAVRQRYGVSAGGPP